MEVIFLKDHLHNVKGDKDNVSKDRANYLINCGVATEVKQEKKPKTKE